MNSLFGLLGRESKSASKATAKASIKNPWLAPFLALLKTEDLRRALPRLGVAAFLSNLLALATPMAILQILDRIVSNRSVDTLILLVIGIVIAIVLEEVLKTINGHVTGWLGARYEHNATITALERVMHVPLQRFQKEEPGAYEEKILAASRVADFHSGQSLLVLFDLPFVLIFLGLILIIGGWLVLVPIFLLMLFSFLILYFGDRMQGKIEQWHIVDDRRFNFLAEILSNMSTIKALTMESLMLRRYERLQESNAELGAKLAYDNELASAAGILFSQIMMVAIIFFGAGLVIDGKMSPGALAACMMLAVRSLAPLRRLLTVWLRFQGFSADQARFDEVMAMPIDDDAGKPALSPVMNSLELRDVSLALDPGKPLFKGISLTVARGECIAIQGDSGSGKSTLMSILNGLVKPDSGECLADGISLQNFSSDSLHKQIALLPQESSIVAGTILENITMFDERLNAEALRISELLGLDQVVAGLKLGYETPLEISESLTEGMRHLINIVRALSCQPSLILFDEANISLDIHGDNLLRDFLASLKGNCTLILVTHRPSMLSLADKVYCLADNRLLEGTLESNRPGATSSPDAVNSAAIKVPERPAHIVDMEEIVHRQFDEKSDLSLCLYPMLDALGWMGPQRELVEAMPHLMNYLVISFFCAVLNNLKYEPRCVHASLAHVDVRLTPCLFLPEGEPALVVLKCLDDGRLRIFDSATSEERIITANAHAGQIYLFNKIEVEKKKTPFSSSFFGDLIWQFRWQLVMAFMLTVASSVLALATPLFVMITYDRVVPSGDMSTRLYLLLGIFLAIALDSMVRLLKIRIMTHVGGRTDYLIGTTLLDRLIHLPTSATEGTAVSRQIGRIKNLESLRNFFHGPLATLVFELPANLVLLAAVAIINPWLLVVVLSSTLAFVLLKLASHKMDERHLMKTSYLDGARAEFLNEALTNMRAIRSTGACQRWLNRFRELSGRTVMANFRGLQMHARVGAVAQVLSNCTGLFALAASALLAINGSLSPGYMIATMMIVWRLVGPMHGVFTAANSITSMRRNMQQVENLVHLHAEKDGGVSQSSRVESKGLLRFSRVSFRYANDADPALLGINFAMEPGRFGVLVGDNGSGKSTLLKLIVRVYLPQAGVIALDNMDIRQIHGSDLRSRISYMPQTCDVFYGTVAQNLRLANPAATDEEMQWAVDMAGLSDDIKSLPRGYATRLSSSRSEQLPHGFRQRLSLARTILKPAEIVLLDEPGTGLDAAGEEALVRCIKYWREHATVLMASHRPSHMRMADVVMVMERGAMIAVGTFEQTKEKIMGGPR